MLETDASSANIIVESFLRLGMPPNDLSCRDNWFLDMSLEMVKQLLKMGCKWCQHHYICAPSTPGSSLGALPSIVLSCHIAQLRESRDSTGVEQGL
jgi:hypothetical protein